MLDLTRHTSCRMSDELSGEYDLRNMSPREKLQALYTLKVYYDAMRNIGWAEHTNDWDWYVEVKLIGGTQVGDAKGGNKNIACDDFRLWNPELYTDISQDNYPHTTDEDVFEVLYILIDYFDVSGRDGSEHEAHAIKDVAYITISQR